MISKKRIFRKKKSVIPDLLFGLSGGIVGTAAMGLYFKSISAVTKKDPMAPVKKSKEGALDDIAIVEKQYQGNEPSTVALGRTLYKSIKGKAPESKKTKTQLSNAIHWTYGTVIGGLYSVLKRRTKVPEIPAALGYGTGLWFFGSEVAVPVLGLSKGPTAFNTAQHAHGLAAHWIYALALSGTRMGLNRIFK